MKITLSILERRELATLLSQHAGDMGTLRVVREAREDLDFTEQEMDDWSEPCKESKLCGLRPESCRHRDKEYVFPKSLVKLLATKLRSMNEEKKLRPELYTIVEKLVPDLVEKDEPAEIEA
jgi:hypothetical protein